MTVDIRPFPRPDSEPLPMEGCTGVEGKVLIREDDFFVAMLRFEPGGTIPRAARRAAPAQDRAYDHGHAHG